MAKIQDHPNALLLLEGNDDFHVIHALCNQYNIPIRNLANPKGGNFSAVDCKGAPALIEQIKVRFKVQTINTIGIIIDADTDLNSRWQSLKDIIKQLDFHPPNEIPSTGLILKKDHRKIGVWIMPDNNINGMLEDFISFLVPTDDKLLPVVDSMLQQIEQDNIHKYELIHKAKARIHAWLSLQKEPDTTLGQSITKRYLTTDQDTCRHLINWLNDLFC